MGVIFYQLKNPKAGQRFSDSSHHCCGGYVPTRVNLYLPNWSLKSVSPEFSSALSFLPQIQRNPSGYLHQRECRYLFTLGEYGGWGVRYTLKANVITVKATRASNWNMPMENILGWGTQKPQELEAAIKIALRKHSTGF
jgi:hypothetical protein